MLCLTYLKSRVKIYFKKVLFNAIIYKFRNLPSFETLYSTPVCQSSLHCNAKDTCFSFFSAYSNKFILTCASRNPSVCIYTSRWKCDCFVTFTLCVTSLFVICLSLSYSNVTWIGMVERRNPLKKKRFCVIEFFLLSFLMLDVRIKDWIAPF